MEKFGAIMAILVATFAVVWYCHVQWGAPWHLLILGILTGPTYFFWRKLGLGLGAIVYFNLLFLSDWSLRGVQLLMGLAVLFVALLAASYMRRLLLKEEVT